MFQAFKQLVDQKPDSTHMVPSLTKPTKGMYRPDS
jgi:hypothetical protein